MALRSPDWQNDCRRKCRCDKCCGPNKGRFYLCDSPCPEPSGCSAWRYKFDPDTCDCAPGFDGSSQTLTYNGTFQDIPGGCLYTVSGQPDQPLTPLAMTNEETCIPSYGDTCSGTIDVSVTLTFSSGYYDPYYEAVIYSAPSWQAFSVENREAGRKCCVAGSPLGIQPYAEGCESIRGPGAILQGGTTVDPDFPYAIVAEAYLGLYKRSESNPDAFITVGAVGQGYRILASTGHRPIRSAIRPENEALCEGTGWILDGSWD